MAAKFKFVYDWRIWIIVVLIVALILWWIFNHPSEEFIGLPLDEIKNSVLNKKPKSKPKSKTRMTSKGEEMARRILEQHYHRKFPPADNEPWLVSSLTKCNLKLDGYNRELGIAFEYNGRQHYEYTPHFHRNGPKDLIYQVQRDKFKQQACKEQKVWLIIIPYNKAQTEASCREHILSQLPENIIRAT